MIKKFRKGSRVHVAWDRKSDQVFVPSRREQPRTAPAAELSREAPDGKAANMFAVHNSADDFALDCIFLPPGSTKARVVQRLIMSPGTAKKLEQCLTRVLHATNGK